MGARRVLDEQVQQRPQVRARLVERQGRGAHTGVGVHDGELDLVLVRAEVHEQLVDRVHDLCRPGIGAVDLVDGHHDRQPERHRLLEHVAGLGQRALRGIHEQQHGIDHQQRPLDLATEVGVTRRIHDVQADVAVLDAGLLGEDGDALLALEVAGVHHPFGDDLVGLEGARLLEDGIDEGRLAVVDVGHDGDVAQVGADGGLGSGQGHGGSIRA